MDISKTIEKAVAFVVKAYLVVLGLCIALQILACWISTVHLSTTDVLTFWLASAAVSVTAYFIRKHRRPRDVRAPARHGSERTPLMPRRGGEA